MNEQQQAADQCRRQLLELCQTNIADWQVKRDRVLVAMKSRHAKRNRQQRELLKAAMKMADNTLRVFTKQAAQLTKELKSQKGIDE